MVQEQQRAAKALAQMTARACEMVLVRHGETAWNAEERLQVRRHVGGAVGAAPDEVLTPPPAEASAFLTLSCMPAGLPLPLAHGCWPTAPDAYRRASCSPGQG